MKYFEDGDQLVITYDDFVNLQESPAVFFPLESEIAKTVLEAGRVIALPLGDVVYIHNVLDTQEQGEGAARGHSKGENSVLNSGTA